MTDPRLEWPMPKVTLRCSRCRVQHADVERGWIVVESVSPGPYLEMFSRRARLGWDTWGDEALHGTEAVA